MINQISLMLQTNTNTPEIGSLLMLNIKEKILLSYLAYLYSRLMVSSDLCGGHSCSWNFLWWSQCKRNLHTGAQFILNFLGLIREDFWETICILILSLDIWVFVNSFTVEALKPWGSRSPTNPHQMYLVIDRHGWAQWWVKGTGNYREI